MAQAALSPSKIQLSESSRSISEQDLQNVLESSSSADKKIKALELVLDEGALGVKKVLSSILELSLKAGDIDGAAFRKAQELTELTARAAKGLEKSGQVSVKSDLLRMLSNDNEDLATISAEALTHILGKRDHATLAAMLKSEGALPSSGLLYLFSRMPVPEGANSLKSLLQNRDLPLVERGEAFSALVLIDRSQASRELAKLWNEGKGSPGQEIAKDLLFKAAESNLPSARQIIREQLRGNVMEAQEGAANFLFLGKAAFSDPALRGELVNSILDGKVPRDLAIKVVQQIRINMPSKGEEILAALSQNSAVSEEIRISAIVALKSYPSKRSMEVLEDLSHDSNSPIRQAVSITTASFRNFPAREKEARRVLQNLINDPEEDVVRIAFVQLHDIPAKANLRQEIQLRIQLLDSINPEIAEGGARILTKLAQEDKFRDVVRKELEAVSSSNSELKRITLNGVKYLNGDIKAGENLFEDFKNSNSKLAEAVLSNIISGQERDDILRNKLIEFSKDVGVSPDKRVSAIDLFSRSRPLSAAAFDALLNQSSDSDSKVARTALKKIALLPEEKTHSRVAEIFPSLDRNEQAEILALVGLSLIQENRKSLSGMDLLRKTIASDEIGLTAVAAQQLVLNTVPPSALLSDEELKPAFQRLALKMPYAFPFELRKYLDQSKDLSAEEVLFKKLLSRDAAEYSPVIEEILSASFPEARKNLAESALAKVFRDWDTLEGSSRTLTSKITGQILMNLGSEGYLDAVVSIFKNSDDPQAQKYAARFLGMREDPGYASLYADALVNPAFTKRSAIGESSFFGDVEQNINHLAAKKGMAISQLLFELAENMEGKNSDKVKDLGAFYQRGEAQGIQFLMRFSRDVGEKLISERENPTVDERPLALVVFPTADYNGAFAQNSFVLKNLIERGYRVRYYEASNEDEFIQSVLKGAAGEKTSLLIFGGHGSQGEMQLGEPPSPRSDNENYSIDISDVAKLRASGISSVVKEGETNIILVACSTGKGGNGAENLANALLEVFPGVLKVHAPETDTYLSSLTFNKSNNVVAAEYGIGLR